MNILIYADPHFCQTSSIIRKQGKIFSQRLENVIQSINWVHETAQNEDCDYIICLGDFFDSKVLTAQEISALVNINFDIGIPMIFLVGNHEMQSNNFNSAKIFSLNKNIQVICGPQSMIVDDVQLGFVPYIDSNEINLNDYAQLDSQPGIRDFIIFSHNDILGYNYGNVVSQTGINMDSINLKCSLFFNGHLHNGGKVSDKIINVGNLTGLNFSEDATKYEHLVYILDTDTLTYKSIVNPYAFNFYTLDFTKNYTDISYKSNSVLSIKTIENLYDTVKKNIENNHNIVDYRIIVQHTVDEHKENPIKVLSVNHLDEFSNYVLKNIGNDDITKSELSEVLK